MKEKKARTILIAEDDLISCRILDKNLKNWGYTTILAKNGKDAWKSLQDPGLRLALLDWMMPEIDGLELCKKIRLENKPNYTYIILLTARDNPQDIINGLEAGADDYMTKPVNFLELRARLQTGQRIIQLEDKLLETQKQLYNLATKDSLTMLWNRASILKFLEEELDHGARDEYPTSVIMLDIDNFKKINDEFGHLAGDRVLQAVTACLRANVRPYDKVGRYGGDEMLIVLPNCSLFCVAKVAERLRHSCAKNKFKVGGSIVSITLSLGCTSSERHARPTVDRLIRISDKALYKAKRTGRNRVALSDDLETLKKGKFHDKKTSR
jgi:diguanylate cyclase (GGDEF)-like protein